MKLIKHVYFHNMYDYGYTDCIYKYNPILALGTV